MRLYTPPIYPHTKPRRRRQPACITTHKHKNTTRLFISSVFFTHRPSPPRPLPQCPTPPKSARGPVTKNARAKTNPSPSPNASSYGRAHGHRSAGVCRGQRRGVGHRPNPTQPVHKNKCLLCHLRAHPPTRCHPPPATAPRAGRRRAAPLPPSRPSRHRPNRPPPNPSASARRHYRPHMMSKSQPQ